MTARRWLSKYDGLIGCLLLILGGAIAGWYASQANGVAERASMMERHAQELRYTRDAYDEATRAMQAQIQSLTATTARAADRSADAAVTAQRAASTAEQAVQHSQGEKR
ncbi:hypothetical protein [Coralloluteibacterium thermophilus]|uniref:Lipoprotein n=1 Tax=Coralloluteibacterium thermophilum TaxID=2707049 RepID=A0ABV9NL68_9GAMM